MRKVYKLEDLDCAVCAAKMEEGIKKVEGVVGASVSFMTQKMVVDYKEGADEKEVLNNIIKVCKKIEPDCTILH